MPHGIDARLCSQPDPYSEDLDLFPIASSSKAGAQQLDPPGTGIDSSHLPKRDAVLGAYSKGGHKKGIHCSYVALNEQMSLIAMSSLVHSLQLRLPAPSTTATVSLDSCGRIGFRFR
jgi:hypothetical protein